MDSVPIHPFIIRGGDDEMPTDTLTARAEDVVAQHHQDRGTIDLAEWLELRGFGDCSVRLYAMSFTSLSHLLNPCCQGASGGCLF